MHRVQTSRYGFAWRGLHRRANLGIVWVGHPGDYASFNFNQLRLRHRINHKRTGNLRDDPEMSASTDPGFPTRRTAVTSPLLTT